LLLAMSYAFADLALAQRLERTEGRSNIDFVEARGAVWPESGAHWIEVAGAYAVFDGVRSPLTQTFGPGLSQPLTTDDLNRIEAFFEERGATIFHELRRARTTGSIEPKRTAKASELARAGAEAKSNGRVAVVGDVRGAGSVTTWIEQRPIGRLSVVARVEFRKWTNLSSAELLLSSAACMPS
jgi:hypothetical protein